MHDQQSMTSNDEEEKQDNDINEVDTDTERETRSWSIDRLIEEQKWEALLKRLNTSRGKEEVHRRRQSTNNSVLRCCLLKTNIPYDIILTLLQICPEDAQQVDHRNELPLHLACGNKYILQPRQQQQQQLPIHSVTITSCSSSSGVIKALIDAHPEGVQHRDFLGRTPLYRACFVGAPFNVIHELLKAWPEGARTPTSQGAYPIHGSFCYRGDERDISLELVIQALLKEFREGAQHGTMGSSHVPLHTACTRANTSLNVIKALVQAYPDGTKQMDANNNLPLHFACLYGCSYDVIDFLIQQYPNGISQTTIAGNLPLHLSCQRTKTSVEVHSLLVRKYPEGVKISNKRGCLPLHIVCEQAKASSGLGHHVEKIQSLLNVYPEGALHYDEYGNLPINCATLMPTSTDVLCALLQAYPSGAGHFNDHGKFPLHSVCLWDDSDESAFALKVGAIQTLVEAYRDVLTMVSKHRDGATPLKSLLVQAKKLNDRTSKRFENQQRIIEYLVQETYPSHGKTDHENEKSSFPVLHSAVCGGAPLDIIKDLCELFPSQLQKKDTIMGRLPLHYALAGAPVGAEGQDRNNNLFPKFQVALHLIHAYSQASDKEDPIRGFVPFVVASLLASHSYHSKNDRPKRKNVEDTDTKERKDTHKGSGKRNTFHQDDLTVVETLFVLLRYNPCAAIVVDYS